MWVMELNVEEYLKVEVSDGTPGFSLIIDDDGEDGANWVGFVN